MPVMFELAGAFIEPDKTATPATEPEITTCVFVNAILSELPLPSPFLFPGLGSIMGDLPRLSIQSI